MAKKPTPKTEKPKSDDVTPEICPMQGTFKGNWCARCRPDEPGDSYYEGRG